MHIFFIIYNAIQLILQTKTYNCGPCGEYILTQLDLTKTKTNKISTSSPHLMAEHEEQEH